MKSYSDVTNKVYAAKMTIRHCSIPEFGRRDTIKQLPRASPDFCTPLAGSDVDAKQVLSRC